MSTAPGRARTLAQTRSARFAGRKRVNIIALTLSLAAMAFGLVWLVWILWETLRLGVGGLALATFTEMTPPPNEPGGSANAIFGSLVMVALATFVGTPIGIMAGIYLPSTTPKVCCRASRASSTTSCCRRRRS